MHPQDIPVPTLSPAWEFCSFTSSSFHRSLPIQRLASQGMCFESLGEGPNPYHRPQEAEAQDCRGSTVQQHHYLLSVAKQSLPYAGNWLSLLLLTWMMTSISLTNAYLSVSRPHNVRIPGGSVWQCNPGQGWCIHPCSSARYAGYARTLLGTDHKLGAVGPQPPAPPKIHR